MDKETLESRLYEPILENIRNVFDAFYVAESVNHPLQRVPTTWLKNPYLEITANGSFSEKLKLHTFNYYMFEKLFAEGLHPDIMGYVSKKVTAKKSSEPEIITIEVKAHALKLRDVMQAKLYESIFGSKHTFLLSPTGMTGEKMEVLLKHQETLRGNVIIGKCGEDGKMLRFDPRLADKMPQCFRRLCRL